MTTANNLAGLINSSTGNIVIPTSNAGVSFNNSGAIGAATLNDYETGTWTPTVGGTATYTSRTATYTKIGRFVIAYLDMTINSIGTGSTYLVSGLPFSATSNNYGGSFSYFTGLSTGVYWISPQISNSSFWTIYTSSLSTTPFNSGGFMTSGTRIIVTLTYEATF